MLAALLLLSSSKSLTISPQSAAILPVNSGTLIIVLNPSLFTGSYHYSGSSRNVACLGTTGKSNFNFTSQGHLNITNKGYSSEVLYYSVFSYSSSSPCTTTNVYLNAPIGHFFAAGSYSYNGYTNKSLSIYTTNCFFYTGGYKYAFKTESSGTDSSLYYDNSIDYSTTHKLAEGVDLRLKTGYSSKGYAFFKVNNREYTDHADSTAYKELNLSDIECVGYYTCRLDRLVAIALQSFLPPAAIAGIVIACIAVFLIPLICVICFCCGCFACFGCAANSMASQNPTSQASIDDALAVGQYPASQQYSPQQDAYAQQPQYGVPQQSYPQQPYPAQQYPPQQYPQQYPPQQYPPQQYPPQQYPPQQYPPQQMPNQYDVK